MFSLSQIQFFLKKDVHLNVSMTSEQMLETNRVELSVNWLRALFSYEKLERHLS